MRLNLRQWLALGCLLGFGLLTWWFVLPLLLDDESADAVQCHANGGVYYWHKHECFPREAKVRTN